MRPSIVSLAQVLGQQDVARKLWRSVSGSLDSHREKRGRHTTASLQSQSITTSEIGARGQQRSTITQSTRILRDIEP